MEFKESLEFDFIPRIKAMVKKEEEHIASLKYAKVRLSGLPLLFNFQISHSAKFSNEIDNMITRSERSLAGLKKRLEEYTAYIQKL